MYNTAAKCSAIKATGSQHIKFNGAEDFLLKKVGNFVFMEGESAVNFKHDLPEVLKIDNRI
jgi:hypothetical protein